MSRNGSGSPWLPDVQLLLVGILLAERLLSALSVEPSLWQHALGLFLAGLVLFAGRRRPAASLGLAALFAFAGVGWWAVWDLQGLAVDDPLWIRDWGPWILVVAVLLLDLQAARRVARLTGIELVKLARSRLVRLAALACVGVTLLAGWAHDVLRADTGWSIAAGMLGAGFATAQVFVLVAGATAIAGEASQGTLKMILPHAYRRSDWVLAKALGLALVAALLAALVAATAWAWVTAGPGFGDVVLESEGFGGEPLRSVHASAATMTAHFTDTLLAQALALFTVAALGLLVSCCLTNVVGALCASFLCYAALRLGDLVLGLDQDALRRLFTWAPERLRQLTLKFGQGLSEGWDERLPAVALLLCLATAGTCVLFGSRVLARRDLSV
jgi:hypothetical protein